MSIIATFGGFNIIGLPCDTVPNVTAPSSIEWDPQEMVSETDATFGFQSQIFDWQQSCWAGQVSFPPMSRHAADEWAAFILQLRGPTNGFLFGDPKAAIPKGRPQGTPVVAGASQTGYSLVTRGWKPSIHGLLHPSDCIQIGYRMYRVLGRINSDGSGNATLPIWPNLRDQPADGTAIITHNCKGLFRLKTNTGNKFSTNTGNYGLSGFAIREAGVA